MKTLIGKQTLWRSAVGAALAALVAGSALFGGAQPALAADPGDPPAREEGGALRLELAYRRLVVAADVQAVYLDHAPDVAERMQHRVDELAEQGEDVRELEAALDAFGGALAESQRHYEAARAILEAHAGFDAEGRVTDREQAAKTVRDAGRALRDARRSLKEGTIELGRAARDWRREHRPQPNEA
jgi:hypothetical protein